MNNHEKKQQAQFLYMAQGKTQKEIADLVGVSERTIYAWIHQYAWDKLRLAAFQAPATIADNLCSQIVELQNTIASREPGNRFPTPQEAEVIRKLVTCLDKMKKSPSMGQNMQVLETFRNYIKPINNEFAKDLGRYSGQYLEAASVNGYAPYQLEFGVAPVSPIAPFGYEPDIEDTPEEHNASCLDHANCLHVGDCKWPQCHSNKMKKHQPDHNVYGVHYASQWTTAQPAPTGLPTEALTKNGSLSAIPQAAQNDNSIMEAPEDTGSNSAISKAATNDNSTIEAPDKTGLPTEASAKEGGNSAVLPIRPEYTAVLHKGGNHRLAHRSFSERGKQFRNITRHLQAANNGSPLLATIAQYATTIPSIM